IYAVAAGRFLMMSDDRTGGTPAIGVGAEVETGTIAGGNPRVPFTYIATELGEGTLLEVGQVVISGGATPTSSSQAGGISYVYSGANGGKVSAVAIGGVLPISDRKAFVNTFNGTRSSGMIF